MPRTKRRKRLQHILSSKTLTGVLLLVAAGVSLAVGREAVRRMSVQQELRRLTASIEKSERSTSDLQTLIATLQSGTYQEGTARTRLDLQKPGEKVIIVPDLNANSSPESESRSTVNRNTADAPSSESKMNTHRWWDFLFSRKTTS